MGGIGLSEVCVTFCCAVTEIGDKTFFIAAVLAMRNGRMIVYLGCMGEYTSLDDNQLLIIISQVLWL